MNNLKRWRDWWVSPDCRPLCRRWGLRWDGIARSPTRLDVSRSLFTLCISDSLRALISFGGNCGTEGCVPGAGALGGLLCHRLGLGTRSNLCNAVTASFSPGVTRGSSSIFDIFSPYFRKPWGFICFVPGCDLVGKWCFEITIWVGWIPTAAGMVIVYKPFQWTDLGITPIYLSVCKLCSTWNSLQN